MQFFGHLYDAQSDRIEEDFRFIVEELINSTMAGRCLTGFARFSFRYTTWRKAVAGATRIAFMMGTIALAILTTSAAATAAAAVSGRTCM